VWGETPRFYYFVTPLFVRQIHKTYVYDFKPKAFGIAFSIENDDVILNRKSPHAGKRFFIESSLSMKNSI